MEKIYRELSITVEKGKDGDWTFVASDETLDRYDEVVKVSGWQLKNFKKNPQMFWQHNSNMPVGAWDKAWKEDSALKVAGHLATDAPPDGWPDNIPHPELIEWMLENGYIKAVSVGFMPIETKYGEKEGEPRITYLKQELLEVSLVTIPANPSAMIEKGMITEDQAKAYGWIEEDEAGPVKKEEGDPPEKEENEETPSLEERIEALEAEIEELKSDQIKEDEDKEEEEGDYIDALFAEFEKEPEEDKEEEFDEEAYIDELTGSGDA